MCLFIAVLLRMDCQASRISPCRHVDDRSTASSNLFGDCEARKWCLGCSQPLYNLRTRNKKRAKRLRSTRGWGGA